MVAAAPSMTFSRNTGGTLLSVPTDTHLQIFGQNYPTGPLPATGEAGRERALTFRMSAVEGSPGGVSRGCLLVVEAMPCAGSVQGCPARAPSARSSQGRICVSKSPFCWRKQKPTQANSERGTCLFRRCWKRRLWCLQEERVSSQAVWGGGPGPSAPWRASEGAAVPFVRKLLMGPARFYVSAAGQPGLSLSQVPEHQTGISMTQ